MKDTTEEYKDTPFRDHRHYVQVQRGKLLFITLIGTALVFYQPEMWWLNRWFCLFVGILWGVYGVLVWQDRKKGWL